MTVYWLIFVWVAWMAVTHLQPVVEGKKRGSGAKLGTGTVMLLTLVIGFRYQVGGDWGSYERHLNAAVGLSLWEVIIEQKDPAYAFLNWFGANIGGDIYLVNLFCGLIFSFGLVTFCRAQPNQWLALAVAVPYLILVVAMGYTRQGVAIGLAMLGMTALLDGKQFRFFLWVVFAALFHKSAVILVPLAFFSSTKNRIALLGLVSVTAIVLFVLLLKESIDGLTTHYVEAEYASAGGVVRVAMNALPAILYILYEKRFDLKEDQNRFWRWMAIFALLLMVLILVSNATTAIDRLALYWIPVQIFVLSRIPIVLGVPNGKNRGWNFAVLIYSFLVMFVWLNFGDHALYWLPYKFFPWEWLWE